MLAPDAVVVILCASAEHVAMLVSCIAFLQQRSASTAAVASRLTMGDALSVLESYHAGCLMMLQAQHADAG